MKKKKWQLKMTRRQLLKAGMIGGVGMMMPMRFLPAKAWAISPIGACNILGDCTISLHDPAYQFDSTTGNAFTIPVPDALSPGFKYVPDRRGRYHVKIGATVQDIGLVDSSGDPLSPTPVWGYGPGPSGPYHWPGMTFEVMSSRNGGPPITEVNWTNNLDPREVGQHLLPVDTSLHWCYSLPGYTNKTIARNGVPIITHLHGGNTDWRWDGNPEFFYTYNNRVIGPQWEMMGGGNFNNIFTYENDVFAGNLWYHDHALGITRLNVYAGLAGFYFVRDQYDTGLPFGTAGGNTLRLPAWPYEKAYAIQDRMFKINGELFYPAFPGDPYYDGFINGEGATLPGDIFPGGGPTALAEFFGDHMVVNGVVWPKEDVEARYYRLHLLNGMDSRFMAIQFYQVPLNQTDFSGANGPLQFHVIGSDQGLANSIESGKTLVFEPGSRYDIVFNFGNYAGSRIIMKNIGGDQPFNGELPGPQDFDYTDRIMAFDVVLADNQATDEAGLPNQTPVRPRSSDLSSFGPRVGAVNGGTRQVALFEGRDEFGRLQPLLGTVGPATDYMGNSINWPDEEPYISQGLIGPMEGSIPWHAPTTENPPVNVTEEWEIWNVTGDAHPVHLHLVHFAFTERREIVWDSATEEEDRVLDSSDDANGDGTYLLAQPVVQHNGEIGQGFKIMEPKTGSLVTKNFEDDGYAENSPKDMVTALPDQVTIIKAKFNKPGRYVWHCHILSHEDHEMMRVLHVGAGANPV